MNLELVQWGLIGSSIIFNFIVLGNIFDLKKYINRGEFVTETVKKINDVQLKR